jgi:hypothetical protein
MLVIVLLCWHVLSDIYLFQHVGDGGGKGERDNDRTDKWKERERNTEERKERDVGKKGKNDGTSGVPDEDKGRHDFSPLD